MKDERMLPQTCYDVIVAEIWRRHARELQELLDHQNKQLYEIARERDRLLARKARKRLMATTTFKVIPKSEFVQKYPEADLEDEALEDFGVGPGALYGEVKIPGNGFVACLIQDGKPYVFYDEDDGWGECPKNVEHVQI